MTTLERLAAITERRAEVEKGWNRLIRQAASEGHPLRTIGAAAGISHNAISKKLKARP